MASYVNGFTKHDDIFHDAKRNKAMKSLLSNMLQMNSQDNREDQRNFDLHDLDEDDDELDLKEEDRALRDAEDTVSAVTAASGTCTASVSVEQALDESSYLLQEKDTSRDRSRSRGWSDDRERLWEADVEGEQLLAGKKQPASWRESDHESQTTVRSIPLPPEGSLSKGASVAEKSKQWNYATASNAALTPFLSLVCMPRVLRRSEAWGRPTSFLQVTNFSSQWLVEVNWVDEDGCLVPRCALPNGKTHIERCSSEHVWVLTALRTASKTGRERFLNELTNNLVVKSMNGSLSRRRRLAERCGVLRGLSAGRKHDYACEHQHQQHKFGRRRFGCARSCSDGFASRLISLAAV